MKAQIIGVQFKDYQQYCDVVDDAFASIPSPLISGLPTAKSAQESIISKRFSYVKAPDYLLIFRAHVWYYKLYYIVRETATLAMPQTDTVIIVDQVRLDTKEYLLFDALMERSDFMMERINMGMERKLDDTLKREMYVHEQLPANITVGLAMPGELFSLCKLLRAAFNPVLDELPSRSELREMIINMNVFVIRDHAKIAAVVIRIPRGASAMLHWIAVDPKYRNYKLSGLLHYAQDLDSKERGFRQSVIWVNQKAEGWIRAIEKRGYTLTRQRLYSYVYGL